MHRLIEFYSVVTLSLILFFGGTSNVTATPIELPPISAGENYSFQAEAGVDYLLQVEAGETLTLSNSLFTVSDMATLTVINYGTLLFGNLSIDTLAAVTSFVNYGDMIGNIMYIKDENDETSIINYGSLEINYLTMVANGGTSSIDLHTYGSSQLNTVSADANYGGLINIWIHEGGILTMPSFFSDASPLMGSNGRPSQINLIDLNPVPEPTTMLLFGTGLAALAGCRRKRK